jgi:hypothetical protein
LWDICAITMASPMTVAVRSTAAAVPAICMARMVASSRPGSAEGVTLTGLSWGLFARLAAPSGLALESGTVFERMEKRWERRWEPVVTRLEARASRVIEGRAPAQVWEFIRPAESAVLIDPSVVRAFTVPGTGPGVGEQQCFITRVGGREVARLVTVVAVEEGVFADVVSDEGLSQGGRFALEDASGGTRLIFGSWVELPEGCR